jgi:hypothetical protein
MYIIMKKVILLVFVFAMGFWGCETVSEPHSNAGNLIYANTQYPDSVKVGEAISFTWKVEGGPPKWALINYKGNTTEGLAGSLKVKILPDSTHIKIYGKAPVPGVISARIITHNPDYFGAKYSVKIKVYE